MSIAFSPTRDASPPLVLAFGGSVWWLRLVLAFVRMVVFHRKAIIYKRSTTKKWYLGPFTILQKLYLPSILHLTLTRFNSLIVNALLSVRCYKFHLHASYTTYTLPHGTSTGGRYYGIGEQKSLLLRQIFLRPCAVLSTAYVHVDCEAAG